MTTAWSHLPNAEHIDRIIASVKSDKHKWNVPNNRISQEVLEAAWLNIGDIARSVKRDYELGAAIGEIYVTTDNEKFREASLAAADAIVAFVVYDDCAYMLDSDPDELVLLAKLGDERAIMLYMACDIISKTT